MCFPARRKARIPASGKKDRGHSSFLPKPAASPAFSGIVSIYIRIQLNAHIFLLSFALT
ncbi:hypothetical protein LHK_01962 [Laribacter hongkongensis HLHK9]|uniref:Uncharacterized protein n=1 Tax=Laribacter hongkongensis (strain HLHK9) TaxID=557598 RepID=C1D906_LARHH|nr:hypothetical protein LHK_01962 [Laribacter hongkongensis HLHK9]